MDFFISIFIVMIIIFIILLFNIFFSKTIIETLQDKKPPDMSIDMSISTDFCKSNLGSLKESCSKLTNNNCNMTSCCVVVNGKKCAAGSKNGPTYKTESGKNINIDYYYYQNKCYGDGCPSKK
jgi:regulatory protein YycI of two-component signal transduction system YycFG